MGVASLSLAFPAAASGYPRWWLREAACIRQHESGGRWHLRNPPYASAYEFLPSTWIRYAPRSWPRDPAAASPAQQTLVAWRDWRANGHHWGGSQWPSTSRICGVR